MEKMFDAMEYLEKDPIIEYYINFSSGVPRSTINGRKLPNYSETLLRLAARQALGSARPVDAKILQLYRKLILFYFAETYTAVDDLRHIMPCFSESELLQCFEEYETIRDEWASFTRNNLMYFIRKRAFFAILSEWTRRYMKIDRNLDSVTLRNEAFHIHSFFKWGSKGIVQWLRSFETNTLKSNWESESNFIKLDLITHQDLRVDIIALDVKEKLHPLIVTELEDILRTRSTQLNNDNEVSQANAHSKSYKFSPTKRYKIETTKSVKVEETDCIEMDNLVEVYELSGTESDEKNEKHGHNYDQQENEEIEYANDDNGDIHESGNSEQNNESDESEEREDGQSTDHNISVSILNNDESEESYGNDDYKYDDDVHDDFETSEKVHHKTEPSVLNDEQATKYLFALQAYMVVNGFYDAIPLLDRVDSILRENLGLDKGAIS